MSGSQQLILGEGAGGSGVANYIEDVFSTYLYTGNGSTQTITNGIDLSTKGGLVWVKSRSAGYGHYIFDTNRGALNRLASNGTGAESSISNSLTSFLSNGFSLGSEIGVNESPGNYASWTFRKQPKFFDVVTWTGNGTARTIAHSLGSVPGCMIIKRTDAARDWAVYHRSLGATKGIYLNSTAAEFTSLTALWNGTTPTSTEFSVGTNGDVNASGGTYVAYLFAHDAGGFGLTGTDNVISCGSFTTDAGGAATVTLGYEPQWVMIKRSDANDDWIMLDVMRGMSFSNCLKLAANATSAEFNFGANQTYPNATGFTVNGTLSASATYIYIAIRRGPMKTPTSGTSVFSPALISGTGSSQTISSPGFAPDLVFGGNRSSNPLKSWVDKLRGRAGVLQSYDTSAEASSSTSQDLTAFLNTGFSLNADWNTSFNTSGSSNNILWTLQRAPGFFDVVCYSGSSSNTTQTHNLGVVPEMIIVKSRNNSRGWPVYTSPTGAGNFLFLNSTDESAGASTYWNNTTPTASVFSLGTAANTNNSGDNYVAYLFATLAGVSKVGSYTGTGNTLQINCGFTGGARFVLIKRTDVAGAWYVWDSARGIVSGNDPYLVLNSSAAEVTTTDWVDSHSPGFELSNAAGNNVNINGGTFVFLAIA